MRYSQGFKNGIQGVHDVEWKSLQENIKILTKVGKNILTYSNQLRII